MRKSMILMLAAAAGLAVTHASWAQPAGPAKAAPG